MSTKPFAPRINHVAISVDADLMDEAGRAALLDFFSEIFGWTEGDNSTEKGNPLILYTGSLGQFLYLLPAKDEFMVTPNMDHFGMEVSSMEEMAEILERVKAYKAKDDRVRFTEVGAMVTKYGEKRYTLSNAYIWFLIPLWMELQHIAERRCETGLNDLAASPGLDGGPHRRRRSLRRAQRFWDVASESTEVRPAWRLVSIGGGDGN